MSVIEEIAADLRHRYDPRAIIAHGSRVHGDAAEDSDYDFCLVFEDDRQLNTETIEYRRLDLSAVDEDCEVLDAHGVPIWPLRLMYDDTNGSGAALVARTQTAYAAGPLPVTAERWTKRQRWLEWQLAKLGARSDDDLVRMIQAGEIAERLLGFWFDRRGLWTQSRHRMAAWIVDDEPAFYDALLGLFGPDCARYGRTLQALLFNA